MTFVPHMPSKKNEMNYILTRVFNLIFSDTEAFCANLLAYRPVQLNRLECVGEGECFSSFLDCCVLSAEADTGGKRKRKARSAFVRS